MADQLFKHTEDGGDLNVFASKDGLLFVCSLGHFWLVEASQMSGKTARSASIRMTSDFVRESFGESAAKMLKFD